MSINNEYKFISKGEWFKKGTEAKIVDDCFWKIGNKDEAYQPIEDISLKKEDYFGLFKGIRISKYDSESRKKGEEYDDQEVCSLEEFDVIRIKEFKKEESLGKQEKQEKKEETNVVCESSSA